MNMCTQNIQCLIFMNYYEKCIWNTSKKQKFLLEMKETKKLDYGLEMLNLLVN